MEITFVHHGKAIIDDILRIVDDQVDRYDTVI